MKGVESRPINDSTLVANKHLPSILKRIDNDCTCIAEPDLEHRLAIPLPPLLAHRGMVITKLEQVTEQRNGARYLWYAFNFRDVCCERPLSIVRLHSSI